MSCRLHIRGIGAVSPAGWGVEALDLALAAQTALATQELPGPVGQHPFRVRRVPVPARRPAFLTHARLRRSSAVSHFAVAAALEALGSECERVQKGDVRLGIVCSVMTGGVNYSRRFYREVLENPATASPLLFPETVFNAPASHLAAVLGCPGRNYTLMGDQTAFIEGLALGAVWLVQNEVDLCLVVATEEADWLTAEALGLFEPGRVPAEGAGALCLGRAPETVELIAISEPVPYVRGISSSAAAVAARQQFPTAADDLELGSTDQTPGSVNHVLGEGFAAGGAWHCVAAVQALRAGRARRAGVTLAGSNHQAIATQFQRTDFPLRP